MELSGAQRVFTAALILIQVMSTYNSLEDICKLQIAIAFWDIKESFCTPGFPEDTSKHQICFDLKEDDMCAQ